MNYLVTASYDTSRPSRSTHAYSARITPSAEPIADALKQTGMGVVFNNVAHYRGVFASKHDAAIAIINFVSSPAMLVETDYGDIYLSRHTTKLPVGTKVLASRSPTGTYVAA